MDDPAGYGRIVRGKSGRLKKIVEEKDATRSEKKIREVNTGIYLIESSFAFPGLERIQSDNAQKEYYLTDLLEIGIRSRGKVVSFSGALKEEVAGINSRVDLARAEKELRNRIAEFWMREGVTLIDPERTYIEEEVTIGRDTVIYPGTLLSGKTRIGEECTIRSGVSVSNSDIGRGVLIRENCVISESRVGDGVTVGPFAHLRPGAVLMKESHIGNFVEIKKSEIGERSKVNHLSYIGDSVVGNRVNIGAGTITCNYDGSKKHRTVIGDDVFVGSDTQFVAPVRVGQGSLIGAGSTIVEDVPEESLSLSRERQVIKKGWVRKRKLINREQDG
jgi:bifunctional UDP-N-acetylglucosamine pyrophosphorylase/glucosamine-1-phosphate N-acetyltransferase